MREYVQSLVPALPDPRCAEVFALGLRPNPRQVKRTLNIFLLLSRLVEKREELAETIAPVRLAKLVTSQHAYPDLYGLLRLRPGYLRDLEAFSRAQESAREEGVEAELPRLPEALEPFRGREMLRRLPPRPITTPGARLACLTALPLTRVPLDEFISTIRQPSRPPSRCAWSRDARTSARTMSLDRLRPRAMLALPSPNSRPAPPF